MPPRQPQLKDNMSTTAPTPSPSGAAPASARMPAFYIPHGAGPCFFMDWNPPDAWDRTAAFLRGIPASLPARPTAIVLVTAHWLAPQVTLTGSAQPGMLFDYYGFPPHTYELRYPAPGAPTLAERARALLAGAGIAATVDTERGYDHGTFIPLLVAFPDADVPVLQVSLLGSLNAQAHLDYGRALAPLRGEGALIIGSGMSYHNMRGYGDPRSTPISDEFDRWLTDTLARPAAERNARLAAWDTAAGPAGRLCHPPRAEEHLLPLHVVAGAAGDGVGRKVFSDQVLRTTISAFRFD